MISEEDVQRYNEAQECKDCLGWHKHCHAECCKMIFLKLIDPKRLLEPGKYLSIIPNRPMTPSDIWYFGLKDVEFVRGKLRFRKDRIVMIGRRMIYVHKCKYLDDNNLCINWPDRRPRICKALTLETANSPDGWELTDNCLFKYKEAKKDGKKDE